MNVARPHIAAALAAAAIVLAVPGCGRKLHSIIEPGQPPVASLNATRLASGRPDSAAFELSWSGSVAIGRIDHYLIAVDPRSLDPGDPAWQATRETHRLFGFAARGPQGGATSAGTASPDRHVIALRAVDANGEESAPVSRTLGLTNIPPTVQIVSPYPSDFLDQVVPPSVKVTWTGNDPDGQASQQPVEYKYKLFKDTDPQFDLCPDCLRDYYAPGFAGWDSVPGETTSVSFVSLVPYSRYLFVVVVFDEVGDYNPVWSRSTNMLEMRVVFPGTAGPRITMFNQYFNYTYASGGYHNDPSHYVDVQVPAGMPLDFFWYAVAPQGNQIESYRWVLDLADLSDETPRSDENSDWYHWSQRSLLTTGARVGPFQGLGGGRAVHKLFIEARDVNGLVSLGIVQFIVEPAPLPDELSLLIVDDTRLLPDQVLIPPDPLHPDSLQRPVGSWPTAAELDTFLFARGGVRWRMTPNGTLSPPGLFSGYRFDTVSTLFIPGGVMPLELLDQYRHVVWITDPGSATGLTALGRGLLRKMSEPGAVNTLAAYVMHGGQLWIAGGGAGYATMLPWNVVDNDRSPPFGVPKFTSTPVQGRTELGLGRFMFDLVHWRSGFYVATSQSPVARSIGAAGGWPGAPNYGLLPPQLGLKTLADDPTPPFRTRSSFVTATQVHNLEYLSEPNAILVDLDPDPSAETLSSVLDTLFVAQGAPAPPSPPVPYFPACMTYYHGPDNGGLLFSGFDLWTYTRPDLIALTDFVLQQVWGLPREPVTSTPAVRPLPIGHVSLNR